MTGSILAFSILLSAISDCAYAFVVGLMLAAYWTNSPWMGPASALYAPTVQKWLTRIGIVMLIAQSLRPWLLAASMSGSSSFHDNLVLIPSILSSTHQGILWKLNMGAILAFLVAIAWMRRRKHYSTYLAASICLCIVAFVKAASSHAADDGDFTRLEWLQWLHILATAIWAGGILVTGLMTLPALARTATNEIIWLYLQRVSKVATYAVILVLASGLYTADRELAGPLLSLWTSTWGKILTAKVIVVIFALTLGALNRYLCLAKDMSDKKIKLSARFLWFEAVAMLAVLFLSGWLANTAPAM
jgi:copper resistance protein D